MPASTNTLLTALLNSSSEHLLVTAEDHRIREAGSCFLRFVGEEREALLGRPCYEFLLLEGGAAMEQALAAEGSWQGQLLLRDRYRNTVLHTVTLHSVVLAGEPCRLWIMRPVDSPVEVAERRPQYDLLTGLPSRVLFMDRAEQAMLNSRRHRQSVAFLSLGIDGFSRINDGLGHEFGDHVLKETGQRLKGALRNSDSIARMGGDQFDCVVVMTSPDDGVVVTEKLLRALKQPFRLNGQDLTLTASIGISVFPADGDSADILIKQAESAMRHCKHTGGDSYQFFSSEMNERARRRIDLENALRQAIEQQQFLLYYQPKVDVRSGAIVGAEALIRWQHPERGMVQPGEFIPVAEESGLIGPIGAWVMREACRQNRTWLKGGLGAVCVSVNMAAPQFRERDIVAQVAAILAESGLPAKLLELEITEGLLIGDLDAIEEKLHGFRRLGLKIAIDDFGTGYSSLSYLSRFPITTLKIDRAFIHDLENNRSTAEIARAIIGLSRGLDLEVVAEGAETAEHIQFLTEQGCGTVQGFFYSRPLPAAEFEVMLRRGTVR
ncbi:MAG: EAL domain-containing protein [Gammaproteobacteria bacterium]|nr:EAL domain-containing protein [Gammaproteobacteria bacterium]